MISFFEAVFIAFLFGAVIGAAAVYLNATRPKKGA